MRELGARLVERAGRRGQDGVGWLPLGVAGFLLVGTSQAFTVPFTGLGLSPAQLLLLLLGVLWVVTRLAGQRYPLGLGVLSGLIVVRLCFTLISYGLGSGRALTPDQQGSSDQTVVIEATAAVLVIVVATLLRSRRDVERMLRALVAGGALSGTFALVQYATGADVAALVHLPGLRQTVAAQGTDLVRAGVVRVAGAAAQPLELAAVMTTLIPLATAGYFASRERGERAWPWALAAVLMAGGAVVSLSRSVFVGLAVAGLVMALRWPLRRTATVLAAVLATGVAVLVTGSRVVDAVVTVLTRGSDDFSLGSRTVGRDYVLAHVADHLWWGQGPGTYDLTTQPVLDNQYLSQLMETGALGLLLLVAVLGCALWYALQATARRVEPGLRELAVGVAGALVAAMVLDLVLDTAGFVQVSTLIWLYVGLAAAVWRIAAPAEDAVPGPASEDGGRVPVRPGAVAAR